MVYQTRELSRGRTRERDGEKRERIRKEVSIEQFLPRHIFIPLKEANLWKTVHMFFTIPACHTAYLATKLYLNYLMLTQCRHRWKDRTLQTIHLLHEVSSSLQSKHVIVCLLTCSLLFFGQIVSGRHRETFTCTECSMYE